MLNESSRHAGISGIERSVVHPTTSEGGICLNEPKGFRVAASKTFAFETETNHHSLQEHCISGAAPATLAVQEHTGIVVHPIQSVLLHTHLIVRWMKLNPPSKERFQHENI